MTENGAEGNVENWGSALAVRRKIELASSLPDAFFGERPRRNINRRADSVDKSEQVRMAQRQFECSEAGHRKANDRPVRAPWGGGKPRFAIGDKVAHDLKRPLVLCCAMLLLWLAGLRAEDRLAPGARADRVLVEKREHTLTLLDHGKVLKKYRVALGGDPVGPKARQSEITRHPRACTTSTARTRIASSIARFTFRIRMLGTAPGCVRPEWRREAT